MKLPQIPAFDVTSAKLAEDRQSRLTKPLGSLGKLEDISIRLAGITGKERPTIDKKAVIVMAADHGVALDGVSAYPQEVTSQMVMNFLNGGAAINVLAQQAGADVFVVDVGVASDLEDAKSLFKRKIAFGTNSILKGPAMSRHEAEQAIETGIEIVSLLADKGLDLVATGDMGIGNTTPSAAITAVITGLPVSQVTGRGTGVDDEGFERKVAIIEKAIEINKPLISDPLDVLSKVGGFEIGGIAGVFIGAASRRIPVVIDGFISGAAALIAVALVPEIAPYLFASHQSVEVGHRAQLAHLELESLFDLQMRLGEGTGGVIAFYIIEAAARALDRMATFDEAGVSNKE